jgi:glycosyltransferase involved in cell wall biosynthesis
MLRHRPSIGIINSPLYSANEPIFLDKHIRTLQDVCATIYVVTGNYPARYADNVHIIEIESGRTRQPNSSLGGRVLDYLVTQIKLSLHVIKLYKLVDLYFFDIGEYRNVLPMIITRVLRRKTMVIHQGGNKFLESRMDNPLGWNRIIPPLQDALLRICYTLVDLIVCISPSIVGYAGLQRYSHKIVMWGGDYIDTDRFRILVPLTQRSDFVGYAGRLSYKKCVANLVRAAPFVFRERPDVKFLIAGDGEARDEIVREVCRLDQSSVSLSHWIPDEEFPNFLNRLKLFVLPSLEEGLPAVLREAMACGTIVLATPVGAVPDLIKHGETGFIMMNGTPKCIAEGILRVLKTARLDKVSNSARALIKQQGSFEASVERWKAIVSHLTEGKLDKNKWQ